MVMQFLDGVAVAPAVLVSAAIAVSLAMLAAAPVTRPGQPPHGGIRPDPPQHRSPIPTTPAPLCCTDRSHPRHADSCLPARQASAR
jgi:hypothetical protein